MSAKKTTTTAPQPTVDNEAQVSVISTSPGASLVNKAGDAPWSSFKTKDESRLQRKHDLLTTVGQSLAQIADVERDKGKLDDEMADLAERASHNLAIGLIDGIIGNEEANALLSDKFGCKVKGNPPNVDKSKPLPVGDTNASKTPFGTGEAIRKRLVRINAANEFINGRDGGRFFDDMDEEDVSTIIDQVRSGDLSIWTAYNNLAEIRREGMDRKPFEQNPAKIKGFIDALAQPGTAKAIAESEELGSYYAALHEMLGDLYYRVQEAKAA